MTYQKWDFDPILTYSFIAVHLPDLSCPLNQWTRIHGEQGFSWRPGSVSFGTIDSNGPFPTRVEYCESYVPPAQVVRLLRVPFEVNSEGIVFSGPNLGEDWPIPIPAGYYAVYFAIEAADEDLWHYTITFVPSASETKAEILQADKLISPPQELLMQAEPA